MTVHDQAARPETAGLGEFAAAWRAWHARHEARLAGPHGFLAITSLHWLTGTPQRFGDAPGAWHTGPDGVTVRLVGDEQLVIDGAVVRGRHCFGVIPERGGVNASWGEVVIEVARRGGRDIVRPRHPDTWLRLNFAGVPAYLPHPRWVVTGRYLPFEKPRPTTVGAAVDGLQHVYDAPGRDGRVVLDFNRATNLPCAYTDLATCPLPPPENRLPVAIEAGEKIPYERR